MSPPSRKAHSIHKPLEFSRYPVRHFHPAAMAYLDLVDDPLPGDPHGRQRLRLRAGSGKLGPPLDVDIAVLEMFCEQPIQYWPRPQDSKKPYKDWDAVDGTLNPTSHIGDVEGIMDDKGLVYATSGGDNLRALVLIGFDLGTNELIHPSMTVIVDYVPPSISRLKIEEICLRRLKGAEPKVVLASAATLIGLEIHHQANTN
ncbi:hypothetical protein B0O99DRAFT_642483 [Bisporella sp. PMI_857]|nr:hypothetical protein B0O99DRAFT_642483 [Bisporella sp. PMI_857]